MRLILSGPPGSGKGTQAQLLSERLGLVHIGTGDILRDAIRRRTGPGRKAEPYVNSGRLVPDALVNDLVAECFTREDRPEHFVLDGYPRTRAQAAALDQVLRQQFLNLSAVVLLVVDDEEIVRRLDGRWSCPGCKATYHVVNKPPRVPGVCDVCKSRLLQREDDSEATIRKRLKVYHRNMVDLVDYYRAQGLLLEVPGKGDIAAIYADIMRVLKQAGATC